MSRRADNAITIDIATKQTFNATDVGVVDASTGKRAHSQYEEQIEDARRSDADASDAANERQCFRDDEKKDRSGSSHACDISAAHGVSDCGVLASIGSLTTGRAVGEPGAGRPP